MSERENGQLPLAERAVRGRIPAERWEQIKTAYASGIGLREIARKMGIPEGTVLARAKREGWSREIQNAKALAKRNDAATTITPFCSGERDHAATRPASRRAHGGRLRARR